MNTLPQLYSPNLEFFNEYGTLDDENSLLSKSQLLMIRHGISEYNQAAKDLRAQLKEKYPDDETKRKAIELEEFGNQIKNSHIVDAQLHQDGIKQAQNQQELLNSFNFSKVLVSPHRRTIQTAVNVLKSHPQLKDGITFTLFPMAKEILNNANDLPVGQKTLIDFTNKITEEIPQITFDFQYINAYKHPNLWFVEIL